MTTVIYEDSDFVACDSKWACENTFLAINDHIISKYVYFKRNENNYIAFFAGDEYPIVLYQALYQEGITHEEFLEQTTRQAELDLSIEWLIIDASDGSYVSTNATMGWFFQLRHLGTGGLYAAHFFHYSKALSYNSEYKNNVVGAMKYAYHKDEAFSGPPFTLKSWNDKHPIDDTVDNYHHLYTDTLISRLGELKMNYQNGQKSAALPNVAKLSSVNRDNSSLPPLKTSPSNGSPKVTVSGAISMLSLLNSL